MNKKIFYWLAAILVTFASAVYQRMTGPSYPKTGRVQVAGKVIRYSLPSSHETTSDCIVSINTGDSSVTGFLSWKRHKTDDSWEVTDMAFQNGSLTASLPRQPAAGKLEYFVVLKGDSEIHVLPHGSSTVIRFRGPVPSAVLIIHVIVMFAGMLLSTRAGIAALAREPAASAYTYVTLAFILAGGLFFGPLVQKYAFGAWWTGWPFGHDLTDNKTAIAAIMWIAAAFFRKDGKPRRNLIIWSAVITLVVFLIPHSLLGSELDYGAAPNKVR